jgi:hypothetical protein
MRYCNQSTKYPDVWISNPARIYLDIKEYLMDTKRISHGYLLDMKGCERIWLGHVWIT